jgi:hypothetical protein
MQPIRFLRPGPGIEKGRRSVTAHRPPFTRHKPGPAARPPAIPLSHTSTNRTIPAKFPDRIKEATRMAEFPGRRRIGNTTKQMTQAPPSAAFVWRNEHLNYPRDLAKYLGRDDLLIISPAYLGTLTNQAPRPVVVDHSTKLSPDLYNLVTRLNSNREAAR